jgi:hypothetical protein
MIGFVVGGIRTRFNIRLEFGESLGDHRRGVHVSANKLGRGFKGKSKKTVQNQHLAIAVESGFICEFGGGKIVGGDKGNPVAAFHATNCVYRHLVFEISKIVMHSSAPEALKQAAYTTQVARLSSPSGEGATTAWQSKIAKSTPIRESLREVDIV